MSEPIDIFVVEDSATQREKIAHVLQSSGYRVLAARNGNEAVRMLASHAPGLIITDILMPEMDGYSLCRYVKDHPKLRGIPVILMTSLGGAEDVIAGLECGADSFLTKSCEEEYLISLVERFTAAGEGPSRDEGEIVFEFEYAGKRHRVTSGHRRILQLLLTTYEGAVQVNRRLGAAREELETFARELERKVQQRTEALTREVGERVRAEEALRRSEEKYRYLVENMNEIICTVNARGIVTFTNPAAVRVSGYGVSEIVGRMFDRFIFPDDRATAREHHRAMLLGRKESLECRITTKAGEIRWIRFQSSPILRDRKLIGTQCVVMDITERRSLEERFLQAQKMEAVGRLAGGVAHDFNNMLMVIQGFGDVLARALPQDDKKQMYVGEIRKATDRAASLTQQLLTFSRKSPSDSEEFDLGPVIGDTEQMLKRLIGEDVSLVVSIDPLTPAVKMDRGQFNQVLMNLAVNARDAMPNGGTLTIHTSLMVVDEASPAKPGVAPGEYAILTVGDTGTGIPPEVRAHLFEPFFTTKEKGKGTGLGLATVYGIVEQSGGHVWCASQVGEGTTFSIYLPRARDAGMKTESKSESACGYRGSERVLLVEDEGAVRAILRTVLEENGYSVLACGNSADVARICEDHPGRIDLLIADMVLPGTSGLKIAETMSRRWPGMGVILMSGYADWNECLHMGAGLHCLHLQKPFQAETLLRNMRTMMEKGGAAGGP